jgi:hypothetical protein
MLLRQALFVNGDSATTIIARSKYLFTGFEANSNRSKNWGNAASWKCK